MRRKVLALVIAALGSVFLMLYFSTIESFAPVLRDLYIEQAQARTGVMNVVTAVYLDYRVFDTLLEALLLLISVVAIFQFIQLEVFERNIEEWISVDSVDYSQSEIQKYLVSIIYPLFVILGVYVIANGADSPGGGFQGGAILAAIIMSRYLIVPTEKYDYQIPYFVEKIFYLLILITLSLFITGNLNFISSRTYILIANTLIGAKVAFGLTAIFLRFIYFEEENRRG